MTLLAAIQGANNNAAIPTLAFASLQEFNSFMDSFSYSQYPVNVVVPWTSNGTTLNGRRKAVVPLQGWVLRRVSEDTNNWRSIAVESAYLDPMRVLAIRFIRNLLDEDIIDPEVESVTDVIRPEYAFLSAGLFGVSYTVNLPINQTVCVD